MRGLLHATPRKDARASCGRSPPEARRLPVLQPGGFSLSMRHYVRWRTDMVLHWPNVVYGLPGNPRILEVGSWRGASAVRFLKLDPSRLVLVDPYAVKPDGSWEGGLTQEELEGVRMKARARVDRFDGFGVVEWRYEFSPEASQGFEDESFDLVYIDGDHSYEAVKADMAAWWPKVAPGGTMVLDDHITGRWWGTAVIDAVKEFFPRDMSHKTQRGRWMQIYKNRRL